MTLWPDPSAYLRAQHPSALIGADTLRAFKMFSLGRLAVLVAVLLHMAAASRSAPDITDHDIVNFALNLEYLEANFYSCAAWGKPLDDSLTGGGPKPTGCKKALLSPQAQAFAAELARDEVTHVRFLRSVLGKAAVKQPQIDIGAAFAAIANNVLQTSLSPSFDPYGSDLVFYHAVFIFEDVGVTAYKGAAPLLSDKGILSGAAGILAVEAYHGGAVRALLLQHADEIVYPYDYAVASIIAAISAGRAGLAGAQDDEGLFSEQGIVIAPVDNNAMVFGRTFPQVIKIVTVGGKDGKGGFFPNGVNGKIH